MHDSRHGLAFGVGSYLIWGLFPLYWPLLEPSGAVEILAQRVVWTFVAVLPLVVLQRRWAWWSALRQDRRPLFLLLPAAALIALNWGTYIWGVNHGHVVETSLGYFINPLITCLLGVVVLRERLRGAQWLALGLGGVAVAILTADYGRPPWVSLVLAGTFGCYGLLKKAAGAGAVDSLTVETAALLLPALGYLAFLVEAGQSTFGHVSAGHTALLVCAGPVTAVPLLFFAAAARRLRLSTLGMVQYLAPVLQFLFGVLVFHEQMPAARLGGFGLVWVALVLLAVEGVREQRRARADRAEAAETALAGACP